VVDCIDTSNYYGKAIIGTVSGSTISYGSAYTYNAATTYETSVSRLDSTHFVTAYQDAGNSSKGTAIIGTVSGSTISYGSEYIFEEGSTSKSSTSSLTTPNIVPN